MKIMVKEKAQMGGRNFLHAGPNLAGQIGLRLTPGEVGNKQAVFGGFCIILRCLVGSGE